MDGLDGLSKHETDYPVWLSSPFSMIQYLNLPSTFPRVLSPSRLYQMARILKTLEALERYLPLSIGFHSFSW